MGKERYLIALGSNMRHVRYGAPRAVLRAALKRLEEEGFVVEAASPVLETAPIGPSIRRYANGAALIGTSLKPAQLLARLKHIEAEFGRRVGGMRWRARVLDLDIVLWSGGAYTAPKLNVPHRLFRERAFVLQPSLHIAADWRDPLSGLSVRQLSTRLTNRRSRPRSAPLATVRG